MNRNAVTWISKSPVAAPRTSFRFGNLRYRRLGSLRYKVSPLIPVGDWHAGRFRIRLGFGDVNSQKTVHVGGFGVAQIVRGGEFYNAFKRPIGNFHDQKAAFGAAAAIRAVSGDAEPIAIDGDFEAIALHTCQFDLDDETFIGRVNVGIRDPVT